MVFSSASYGSAVNWWTYGILLHELLYGKTPFKGSGNRQTLFNVVGQQLRFPESPATSYASRDLIRALLVKEPQNRVGVKRGATEIKQHPFFEGVNWALIRCSTPPDITRPVEMELLGKKLGVADPMGVVSVSKRMVDAEMKAGGGTVLRCDVTGKILMKCFLSGMPNLKLGLNDKICLEKESQLKARPVKRRCMTIIMFYLP